MPFETFEHTADLGLRAWADDVDKLFADAARGLFAMIVANPESVRPAETITLAVDGDLSELLLFDWLNELLYLFDVRHLLLCGFEPHVTATGLAATLKGERLDLKRHVLDHEVKAITYHGLKLEKQNGRWLAEVIVDI